jgi:hypothetical protein
MTNEKLVTTKEHAAAILSLVPLSIISGCYALYMNQDTSIILVPFLVSGSSILYWTHPTYSWRRNVDMISVLYGSLYQAYRALYAEYMYYYFLSHGIGILCYFLGRHYHYTKNNKEAGLICHMGVHILANIGNMALYSGEIY